MSAEELVHLIWSYTNIDEIAEYGVNIVRSELMAAIQSLPQSTHLVIDKYPVSYAQKV